MRIFLLTGVLAVTVACGGPRIDLAAEGAAVRARSQAAAAAEAARDREKALTFWALDPIVQPDRAPQIQGREAIDKLYRQVFDEIGLKAFTGTAGTIAVGESGDIAYETGVNRLVFTSPSGDLLDMGKYLAVWKKIDGTWMISALAFSSDAAAPVALSSPSAPNSAAPPVVGGPAAAASAAEIDKQVWSVFIATVAADDIVGMADVYVPNAVLVDPQKTTAIKDTLARWGRDMTAAKAKGTRATVEFRFSRRQDGETTAFESGIFKYTTIDKSGAQTSKFYPFEELLSKTNGRWRVLMERQFAEVTQAEWDKLPK